MASLEEVVMEILVRLGQDTGCEGIISSRLFFIFHFFMFLVFHVFSMGRSSSSSRRWKFRAHVTRRSGISWLTQKHSTFSVRKWAPQDTAESFFLSCDTESGHVVVRDQIHTGSVYGRDPHGVPSSGLRL